jgi:hypothetical protein
VIEQANNVNIRKNYLTLLFVYTVILSVITAARQVPPGRRTAGTRRGSTLGLVPLTPGHPRRTGGGGRQGEQGGRRRRGKGRSFVPGGRVPGLPRPSCSSRPPAPALADAGPGATVRPAITLSDRIRPCMTRPVHSEQESVSMTRSTRTTNRNAINFEISPLSWEPPYGIEP